MMVRSAALAGLLTACLSTGSEAQRPAILSGWRTAGALGVHQSLGDAASLPRHSPHYGYLAEFSGERDLAGGLSFTAGGSLLYSAGAFVRNNNVNAQHAHVASAVTALRLIFPGSREKGWISGTAGVGYVSFMNAERTVYRNWLSMEGLGVVVGADVMTPAFWSISPTLGIRQYNVRQGDAVLHLSSLQFMVRTR